MPKSVFPAIAVAVVTSISVMGGMLSPESHYRQEYQAQTRDRVSRSFREAVSVVEEHYAQPVDNETLSQNSISSMLHALDPHSNFFSRRQFSELQSEQRSSFFGIGVTINRRNGRVYVLGTIPETPAERAGLRYGDAIVAIDGEPATDLDGTQVMEKVRGPRGEAVTLTIERAAESAPIEVRIVRDAVPLPSIRNVYMARPNVGYIALVGGFTDTTGAELQEAFSQLNSQGMQSLILDLRGNHGGLLDQAVEVSRTFLPGEEKIVSVKGRKFPPQEWTSGNSSPTRIPLVVLVNGETASAAEIVAGAIQDHDRGVVVGETSFGKGLVQGIYKLPYGTGLLLTTAKYYTPAGRSIQRQYEGGSLYSYYSRRGPGGEDDSGGSRQTEVRTDSGRAVFGGGGITPDLIVKSPEFDQTRSKLFGATFDFALHLAAGKIKGFESYRITQPRNSYKLTGAEYPVSERLMNAFREYVAGRKNFEVSDAMISANAGYIQNRIRDEMVTAAYGTETGQQFALAHDQQALKAIESLPQAKLLAEKFHARFSAKTNSVN